MLCIVDLFVIIYKKLMQLLITTTINHLDKGSRTEKFTAVNKFVSHDKLINE
jgi:hypothetical protein